MYLYPNLKRILQNTAVLAVLLTLTAQGQIFLKDQNDVITLQKLFASQESSITRAINDLLAQRASAEQLRLNAQHVAAQRNLETVAQAAYENLQKIDAQVSSKLTDLKNAFKTLQTVQTADGYMAAKKTYEANLQPLISNAGITISPEGVYAYIFKLDEPAARKKAASMTAQEILATVEHLLTQNPPEKGKDWVKRQFEYLFAHDNAKAKFDAFLQGQAAFEQWEKLAGLIDPEKLAELINQNVEYQTALDTLKNSIAAFRRKIKQMTGV